MSDEGQHVAAPPKCEPVCGSASCPWCIVRRQSKQIEQLKVARKTAHEHLIKALRALDNYHLVEIDEEPKPRGRKRVRGAAADDPAEGDSDGGAAVVPPVAGGDSAQLPKAKRSRRKVPVVPETNIEGHSDV